MKFRTWTFLPYLAACLNAEEPRESLAVGGQAVMEGIMMRNGPHLALSIRKQDGEIIAIRRPWVTIFPASLTRKKWVRGFPVLLETMINGIKALNISAEYAGGPEDDKIKPWHLVLTLVISVAFAFLLFVVIPHLLTIGLTWLSLAGSVEGVTFHIWDGLLKFLMFIGYIVAIGMVEEIRRVFQYHGAEHKAIAAYESGANPVSPSSAAELSRLHPRCGTTFLLFVLVISILVHTLAVPGFLLAWTSDNSIIKHAVVICFKFFLIIPISALAYEAIRSAACLKSPVLGTVFRSPGLLLQMLTTREPDYQQLEVGLVALKEALGEEATATIETPSYTVQEFV